MEFHERLRLLMHRYVKEVYRLTRKFPKEELYGVTSQLRRAAMSVILNYIEGFARRRDDNDKTYHNFLLISFGSLKESKYLLYFSFDENYIDEQEYKNVLEMAVEISKMLWSVVEVTKQVTHNT